MLENLSVSLRPRNPWEALDLGVAMVRDGWRPVYAAWLAIYLPLALLLGLTLRAWAPLVVWWLKPALDRVVLHVVACAVFGAVPSVKATIKALPALMRHGVFASLSYYRFDFARSFKLPVWQLEAQRGSAARARGKQLHKRTRGYAVWLTLACLNFEMIAIVSLLGVFDLLIPAASRQEFDWFALLRHGFADAPEYLGLLYAAAYLIAVALLEPFYVASGFALYLNRRALLEGWDIEMQMRRLAESKRGVAAATVLVAVLMSGLCLRVDDARALDSQAAHYAKEIKSAPEFQEYRETQMLDYLGDLKTADEKEQSRKKMPEWLKALAAWFAQSARWIMWGVLACAVLAFAYYLGRHLSLRGFGPIQRAAPPATLFGLDVRAQSLPDDVAAAARALARQGDFTAALSLLYRGALTTLIHRDGIEFVDGDTESDCLSRATHKINAASRSYFSTLVASWQRAAYARRSVEAAQIEQLCADWGAHFLPRT